MAWKVTETMVQVKDLDAAIAFYTERLGFTLIEQQEWGFAMLTPDGTAKIGLLTVTAGNPGWKEGDKLPAPRVSLQTDDIEAEVARLREAGVDVDEVKGDAGTLRAVGFRDLDRNKYFLWDDGSGAI